MISQQTKAPLFHVGYMKTGTTWFQRVFFPSVQNIQYFSRDHVNDFFLKNDVLDFNRKELKQFYSNYLLMDKRLVFSSERLIGPVSKGYRDGTYIKGNADRIASVFENAEIIIFVRNQVDLIASCYMQYIRNGGNFGVKRYLHADENALFSLKYLNFFRVIKYYSSLFEKVHIFAYEDFASNPHQFTLEFVKRFEFESSLESTKLTERVNPSVKPGILPFLRFMNLFSDGNGSTKYQIANIPITRYCKNRVYHKLVKIKGLTTPADPIKILGKENVQFIHNHYSDSNARLGDEFKLDFIKRHGYI